MVDARVLKTARLVAIGHIGVGILLVLFGIVDRVEGYFWTGDGCFGIWCGVWVSMYSIQISSLPSSRIFRYGIRAAVNVTSLTGSNLSVNMSN